MIAYTEKGEGLHRVISEAGYWLRQVDRVWTSSDDAAVQNIIDLYPISSAINEVKGRIVLLEAEIRNKVVEGISPAEMSSWSIKRVEMMTYNASLNAGDAPMLSAEAAARGVTLGSIVARVKANSDGLSALEAQIAGNAGITAVIQPGGSIRDKDSIEYCDKNGIAMVLTGVRHFKH